MQRPKENKRQVTMRFGARCWTSSSETGHGWQGRINALLHSFVERQQG
jgi:uncharacterized protein (DUF4415 family)